MREPLLLLIAVAAALTALCALRYARRLTRRVEDMLERAIAGGFAESSFDEGAASALESKMARFLSGCTTANRSLAEEREKIAGLISDISHQTRTPTANILLYASLLEERAETEERREQAGAVRRQAEKLSFLLQSLVKGSRLEAGMISLSPQAGPLQPLLEEVSGQIAAAAERKGIQVITCPTRATACFDRRWTAEALFNIADNAVKYTPAGGRVLLSAAAGELFCRIDVSDTGPGIPEGERANIFRRFYRGAGCREVEGSGLGLYLVREIAAAEEGYVKVSCPSAGGSVFSLYLPRKEAAPLPAGEGENTSTPPAVE